MQSSLEVEKFTALYQSHMGYGKEHIIQLGPEQLSMIESIRDKANQDFRQEERCLTFNQANGNRDPAIRLKYPSQIEGVTQFGSDICESLSDSLYNYSVVVDKCHIYRQLPVEGNKIIVGGSWDWHVDGHPVEFIKVLVFLTPVNPGTSCFELYWSENRERALRVAAQSMNSSNWQANAGRQGEIISDDLLRQAESKGYRKTSYRGDTGSCIIFNTNCVHRGSVGKQGYRDTLMYRIRPRQANESTGKLDPADYRENQKAAL